jgi:HD-GYP domain-containing protein (c-di-GMP phosphodiesterase class II)
MKRKIDIGDLEIGMYVSELDRPWIETPFLFQGFRITNQDEINKIRELCVYVLVDVEKSKVPVSKGRIVASEPKEQLAVVKKQSKPYTNTFEEEYDQAKRIYIESQEHVNNLFKDIRLGKNIAMTEVTSTVTPLADSIFRNPDTLTLLSNIKEANEDLETHSINCCVLSLTFARHLGFDKSKTIELGISALLHDIGETQIPKEILQRRGNLSGEEQQILQSHTTIGSSMLSEVAGIPHSAISVAQHHHERANESGYPDQLSLDSIGLFTKIVAVIDVYDTLTTGTNTQPPLSCSDALKHMYDWRYDLFDPAVVEQFIQCLGIYPIGSTVELNTGDMGVVISIPEKSRLTPSVMLIKNAKGQTYLPPRIANLALLNKAAKESGSDLIEINKVIVPENFDLDLKNFVLRELQVA